MIQSIPGVLLLAGLLVAGGSGALAQQSDSAAPLAEEIAKLNRSLDDIARSLRVLLHDQKINVLIRRIELEERRQAPLNAELRSARGAVRGQKDELAQLEGILRNLESQLEDAIREGADPQTVPERDEMKHLETMLELERERLETAETRVIELENEVARARDRVLILDEQLQELLDESD